MKFELRDSLSLPGDAAKPNEDAFAHAPRFATVIDGATGLGEQLMPGRSDAQWLAQFAARRFAAHARMEEGGLRDWLRSAAMDAEKSFTALRRRAPKENYEIPFASLIAVSLEESALEAVWFGDCAALIRSSDGALKLIGETFDKRAAERERAARLGPKPAGAGVREEFLPALRASRNKVNTKRGEWLFAPDAECAAHAKASRVSICAGDLVLLASDGFLALAADYARYSPQSLLAAVESRGLAALGEELRAIEAADPDGSTYPRFKKSDDATALLLSVAA
jgi:serine/threonine protein phosphatase PrpC